MSGWYGACRPAVYHDPDVLRLLIAEAPVALRMCDKGRGKSVLETAKDHENEAAVAVLNQASTPSGLAEIVDSVPGAAERVEARKGVNASKLRELLARASTLHDGTSEGELKEFLETLEGAVTAMEHEGELGKPKVDGDVERKLVREAGEQERVARALLNNIRRRALAEERERLKREMEELRQRHERERS